MAFNSEMLVLAREYRGLTQDELARKSGLNRIKIAKIESGLVVATEQDTDLLCTALDMPPSFFDNEEPVIGYGSSAYYYRKKADLTAADRKRVHSIVNMIRIGLKPMLGQVEVESQRNLVRLSIDEYGGSAAKVASAIRTFWKLPDGPVKNLTALIEGAGVIVLLCDFGTRSMDATSLWLADSPPMVFINDQIPGDRWRFTLAHELAHLVMHDVPNELMEEEADEFAAEFLMPAVELKAEFARLGQIKIRDLAELKLFWKTSMAALLVRARDLGFLDENQSRYLWMTMSKLGYRSKSASSEPNPIPREQPSNARKLMSLFAEMQFSLADVALLMRLPVADVRKLFDASPWAEALEPQRSPLRLVAS